MKLPKSRSVAFDYEGETVELKYNPRKMQQDPIGDPPSGDDVIDTAAERLQTIADWCVRNITSWNLSDESGDILPITVESLKQFHDDDLILRIGKELGDDAQRFAEGRMQGRRPRWVRPSRI